MAVLCLPEIFRSNLFFFGVYLGFSKTVVGRPGFGMYSLATVLGLVLGVFLWEMICACI